MQLDANKIAHAPMKNLVIHLPDLVQFNLCLLLFTAGAHEREMDLDVELARVGR